MKDVVDALARIETNVAELVKRKDDHEDRLRSLEKWRWLVVGGALVVIAGLKILPTLVR